MYLYYDFESNCIRIFNSQSENPDMLHKATQNLILENTAKTFADDHKRGAHESLPKSTIYKKARISNALSAIFENSRQTSDPKSELNIVQAFVNLCNLYITVLGLNRDYDKIDDDCCFEQEP